MSVLCYGCLIDISLYYVKIGYFYNRNYIKILPINSLIVHYGHPKGVLLNCYPETTHHSCRSQQYFSLTIF